MIYSLFTSLSPSFNLSLRPLSLNFRLKKAKLLLFGEMGGGREPIENFNSFLSIPFDILLVKF